VKCTLGVKRTTTNMAVLRECGHEPLQFCWFRSVVMLYYSMAKPIIETYLLVFLVSCSENRHGFRYWVLNKHKVIVSGDVRFDEQRAQQRPAQHSSHLLHQL